MGRNNNYMHYYECTCLHKNSHGETCGKKTYSGRYFLFDGKASSCGCANKIDPYDIIGNTYGYLQVENYIGKDKHQHKYNCICKNIINGKTCNNQTIIERNNLIKGRVISCGCYKSIVTSQRISLKNPWDIVGQTFGYLEVKEYCGKKSQKHIYKCICHNELFNGNICNNVTIVDRYHLISGHTTSCGCYLIESSITHGLSKHPLYCHWICMKSRCYNQNDKSYKHYGKRGIKVCDAWNNNANGLQNFINDMYPLYIQFKKEHPHENLSIDRINVNKDYEPNNCRWATPKMQASNKRNTAYFIYNEQKYTIADLLSQFCEKGLTYTTMLNRLRHSKRFCKDNIIFNDEVFKLNLT